MASMPETNGPCFVSPRILAETLEAPSEPLALLVDPLAAVSPADACRVAARALLDLSRQPPAAPSWLAPHQVRAFDRIHAIVRRFGGAVLADAVGSGKSYIALAVAHATAAPLVLVVPAVLVDQWRALIARLSLPARIETHERFSRPEVAAKLRARIVRGRRRGPSLPQRGDATLRCAGASCGAQPR